MACLSKLDRQLKDLEEKLKYILIIRKIRRRRVLRDKKPRKTMTGKYTKTEAPRTSCRPRVINLYLLYFKNTNFRTFERMRAFFFRKRWLRSST